jgi:hypothetical protein
MKDGTTNPKMWRDGALILRMSLVLSFDDSFSFTVLFLFLFSPPFSLSE